MTGNGEHIIDPRPEIDEDEISKAKTEIRDLSSRLYYCSNSGEGRKVRKWIETRIRELEKFLEYQRDQ